MVISHALWQGRFGGSPSVIGSALVIEGRPRTIVGVLPARFAFMTNADVWALIDRTGPFDQTRDSHSHILVGRLKAGVSLAQAQQDVSGIARGLAEKFPDTNARKGLQLAPLHDFMVRDVRNGLLLLLAVTALVLLIACANVTGLLLAKGQRRLPEMAMRSALGASRWRLVRQLLTESVILTVAGGLLGLGVAYGTLEVIFPLLSTGSVGIAAPALDGQVLLFAVAVSIGCGLFVGIVPAFRGTAAGPAAHLGMGRQTTESRRGARLRGGLVVVQVAFSIVLLVVSGLFLQSLARVGAVELGFDPESVLTTSLQVPNHDFPAAEDRQAYLSSLLEEVGALPGVTSASAASKLPIQSRSTDWPVWRADRPKPQPGDQLSPLARWVYPRYFETMRIPLKRGRDITLADGPGAPKVVVISEIVSRTLYPGEDPIGRPLTIWGQDGPFEIVGVAADAVLESVFEGPRAAFYIAAAQMGPTSLRLAIRTTGDPASVAASVRDVVRRRGRNVLVASELPMTAVLEGALTDFRALILSLGLFAAAALMLTAVGLYGTLAYHVSQQQHEIGVRLAVGAPRGSVLALVLKRGGALAALGLVLGGAGAVAASRFVGAQLFATTPYDPAAYAGAFVLLAVVAALACLVPALRATRTDPVAVLRGE